MLIGPSGPLVVYLTLFLTLINPVPLAPSALVPLPAAAPAVVLPSPAAPASPGCRAASHQPRQLLLRNALLCRTHACRCVLLLLVACACPCYY